MEGASVAGGIVDRVVSAWNAGCDMLLVCNAPGKVDEVLENWRPDFDARRSARVAQLLPSPEVPDIKNDPCYRVGVKAAERLERLA